MNAQESSAQDAYAGWDCEVRPAPRTDGWYATQAELEYAGLPDGPVKREKVQDFVSYLKQIDGVFVKNSTLRLRFAEAAE